MGYLTRCARHTLPLVALALGLGQPAFAEAADPGEQEYVEGGVDECLQCHDEDDEYPVLSILATPHAVMADDRTPLSQEHACQTCHGPSSEHMEEPDEGEERVSVSVQFGSDFEPRPQTGVCTGCHRGGTQMNWEGSTHESEGLACTSCHQIHTHDDPVRSKNIRPEVFTREGQAQVCFGCHAEQRALAYRAFSHPLREGKMNCSGCHAPHGSMGKGMLVRPTLNETCYQCHAEKRGPFLWEHPPAREDCSHCHTPHGSNHPALLTTRGHLLCQQCHMASRHPSTAYTGVDAAAGVTDFHTQSRNCLNCHTEVHGSNHPSGPRLTR